MERVKLLSISGKQVISVDYAGCNTEKMIEVFNEARPFVENSSGGCLILTNFENSFITGAFMRHAEKEMLRLKHLIKKNAFIGMSLTQRMILGGFVLFIGRKEYVAFGSRQEAIDYLLREDE